MFDVRGRIVGQLNGGGAAGGKLHDVLGRSTGRRARGAGIYFVKVDAAGERSAAKLVVLD